MSITIISCFEIQPGHEDDFVALYHRVNDYMAQKPGFLGNTFHRALVPGARFAFVNVIDCGIYNQKDFRTLEIS